MDTVLCFGDSNTYGLDPRNKTRFDYSVRWTGLLDSWLRPQGKRVAEEGLCGRTADFSDMHRPGRWGTEMLPVLLETHSPEWAVIMLGTNDCKTVYNASPEKIGNGISALIGQAKRFREDMKILIVSPIRLADGVGEKGFDEEFDERSVMTSLDLKRVYRDIAKKENCLFLAASDYASPSAADREHLDENGHKRLAEAIYGDLSRA